MAITSAALTAAAEPLVIAHRGASGYLPEHTLQAAELAYQQGADYIEQDLVLSKDGVAVVLHDVTLETVTDVEQRYAERKRADGHYYAIDFTLAELKTLRVHERTDYEGTQVFPDRYRGDDEFAIATFAEQLELIQSLNKQSGGDTGFYVELKAPAWHREQGMDISKIVLAQIRSAGLDEPDANIFIQCFDFDETQRLRNDLQAKLKLVQLIADNSWGESGSDYDWLRSDAGLAAIAEVANGIGPWIPQIIDLESAQATSLTRRAQALGLAVHPYTFRIEQLQGRTSDQVLRLLFNDVGVDGVFTDFTDVVVEHLQQQN